MAELTVRSFEGDEAVPFVDDLALLRIAIFREYPYLYDGDLDYERQYLRDFCERPGAVLIVARDAERVVGVATAMPLAVALPEFQQPFREAKLPLEDYYYLGESVLQRAYRGQGIGRQFFAERHRAAGAKGFGATCFCAVDRATDDPRRPHGYRSLGEFWRRQGYRRKDDLRCFLKWSTIDHDDEQRHQLTFWVRDLSRRVRPEDKPA